MSEKDVMQMTDKELRFTIARIILASQGYYVINSERGWFERQKEFQLLEVKHMDDLPDWPHDIAAAWELLKEAEKEVWWQVQSDCDMGYKCTIGKFRVRCDFAPIAICRAWLMWKEAQK